MEFPCVAVLVATRDVGVLLLLIAKRPSEIPMPLPLWVGRHPERRACDEAKVGERTSVPLERPSSKHRASD
jgi:hypothetical protein